MSDTFLTIHEAAATLRVADGTIRNLINSGKLPAFKILGTYRVRAEDLRGFVEGCRVIPKGRKRKPRTFKAGGSPFKYLDAQRLLAAWQQQGEIADPPGEHTPQLPVSSYDPSAPPAS